MDEINYKPVKWLGNRIRLLDQTRLPQEEVYLELNEYREVARAIREMEVRGAPAIGVTAAFGIALGAIAIKNNSRQEFMLQLNHVIQTIAETRPTARNLFTSICRMEQAAKSMEEIEQIKKALTEESLKIETEETEATERICEFGAQLIPDGSTVLTHCNTGPLATTGSGTALGIIIRANKHGKKVKVFTTETRPLLQGSRLTSWELKKASIPFKLITESMAGYFLNHGEIEAVVIGADCIAANGDTANKIGSYTLAVLAMENGVPFYVAAPLSTIDLKLPNGKAIPIEERNPEEVTHLMGIKITPHGTIAANPAFDVTPHQYITAIITNKGIIREPYIERLKYKNENVHSCYGE